MLSKKVASCLTMSLFCSITAYAKVESCPNPENVMADRAQGKLNDWFVIPAYVTSAPTKLSSVELVTNHQLSERKNPDVVVMAGGNAIHRATGSFVKCNYEGRQAFSLIKDASTFKVSPKYFTVKPVQHSGWAKVEPMMHTQGQLSCQPSHENKCEFDLFPIDCVDELQVIEDRMSEARGLTAIAEQNYLRNHPAHKARDVIRDSAISQAMYKEGMLHMEYQQKKLQCDQ